MASVSAQTSDSEIIAESTMAENSDASAMPLYIQLLALEDDTGIFTNTETFDCIICLETINTGDGVRLRNCLHEFCRDCLQSTIIHCKTDDVECPFRDSNSSCGSMLQDREIRAILSKSEFEQYLARTLRNAEIRARDAIHCKLANCDGWCFGDGTVNEFKCQKCEIHSSLRLFN